MYFENLTKQYELSKTLRFNLIPQGKTLENIKNDKEAEEILEYEEEIEEDIELSTLMKNTLFPSSGEDIGTQVEM